MSNRAPRAADVVGVPMVPPAGVSAAANRLRALIGRAHRAMAPPPVQVLKGLFGILDHAVLVTLCQAGVPDALNRPTAIDDLAAALGADPARLERLLRYAATRGWVRLDRQGRVRPTRTTAFLRVDHPGGWRAWVDFAGGQEVTAAIGALTLDPAVTDAFAATNGAPFFEWMAAHPARWATFDGAMAAGGRMHALTLAAALDWRSTRRVCDVGGGTGDLLAGLVALVPTMHGTVFDLPAVVARAVSHERLEAVGGDAFVAVPGGFDTYLLVNVLHDWDDDDAARLLGRVAEAAAPGARVVVVDSDRPRRPQPDLALGADVLMAALTPGGKERDAAAFTALAERCGLTRADLVRLASGDVAHVFTR